MEIRPPTLLVALLTLAAPALGDEPVDYATRVKPVLQARCYACHGVLKQKGRLRLDTAAFAKAGGENGPAVEPGDAGSSLIIDRITAPEGPDRMPPEGERLKPEEVAALRDWINQGAKAPADDRPERDPRDHWAFKAPVRPAVPPGSNNPIDAFISADRKKRGLTAVPPADRRIWLRRVSIDLVGLPPTRKELDAFVADESADAVEKVITRLLDSPQHGERWGRHWMDIWRYSDWWGLGAEVRNSQKHIWHWRDWIIESLNADKGYDQMLREMLAADELYPDDPGRLRASGFLARQYFKFNRTSWLDEAVEHTSKAMLGLTFNCAKCHDHKYDPIAQVDYYRLRAVFEPYQVRTDAVPGEIDFEKDGIPRAFDCNLDAPTYVHIRGDDRNPDKAHPLTPGFPAFLPPGGIKVEPVTLPAEAAQPGLRPWVVEAHRKAGRGRIEETRAALDLARKAIDRARRGEETPILGAASALGLATAIEHAAGPMKVAEAGVKAAEAGLASIEARSVADRARHRQPPELPRLIAEAARAERLATLMKAEEDLARAELALANPKRGTRPAAEMKRDAAKTALDAAQKAMDAPATSFTSISGSLKMFESNLETEESRHKPFPKTSTGRRSALARWITDPANPLPARVAVNHLWSRHFGRPLVPTVFDFGRKGTPSTHPELLDWLAVELVEHGWSMKHIHRLIVTSETYRLSSSSAGALKVDLAADPENRYYWRANPTRLEAQAVRDSLLSLSGELDPKRGGPSIPVADESSRRRSLYFVHSHNEHQKFLSIFDDASVLECYRRAESVVPQQALALENSPLATAAAAKIAGRIAAESPGLSDRDFVRSAFLTVLAIEPTEAERSAAIDGLSRLADAARRANRPDPTGRARSGLVLALLNHNDFVTVR